MDRRSIATVILVCLVATVIFAGGATMVISQTGTSSFTEDTDGTTQLLQTASNVLAKEQLLYMLEAQQRLSARPSLEIVETSSAAQVVAR